MLKINGKVLWNSVPNVVFVKPCPGVAPHVLLDSSELVVVWFYLFLSTNTPDSKEINQCNHRFSVKETFNVTTYPNR